MDEITEAMTERSFTSDYVMRYHGLKVAITILFELEALILNRRC